METKKTIGIILGVVIFIICSIFFLPLIRERIYGHKQEKTENQSKDPSRDASSIHMLVGFNGTTPCNTLIDYKFSIQTSGPVYIKFAGIEKPIFYSGQGEIKIDDPNLKCGEAYFTSATAGKAITITVYKVN